MTAAPAYREWGRRLRKSDEQAFRELFEESYNPLLRYANTFLNNTEVSRDILQEVYAHLWQIRERIDEEKSLKALLYRMTKNRCINHIRGQRSTRLDDLPLSEHPTVNEAETAGVSDIGADEELQRLIPIWLEALPERQREAFELSRFEGLDHDEIAEFMACAPRTVNNHIVSALRTLRSRLDRWREKREA